MSEFSRQKNKNGGDRFVSEEEVLRILQKQLNATSQTFMQLRRYGVDEGREKKLEYFFTTDAAVKAEHLSDELRKSAYRVEHGKAAEIGYFFITGWTVPLKMSEEAVLNWTRQMVDRGYRFDCRFDGWGTSP
jgi:hypothetical protein